MNSPRISIITPSFNQAQYIEQTICSVLDQGYPNLEYFVMDGGSTDGTVEVLKKYEKHLTGWVSEKDRGQTHAINKGFARASGDVRAYINSDDWYLPGVFHRVARHFSENPGTDLLHGACMIVDQHGAPLRRHLGKIETYDEILDLWNVWWKQRQFIQPEVFWSRRLSDTIGPFREDLNIAFDFEYWVRALKAGVRVARDDADYACFRIQPNQKTSNTSAIIRDELAVVGPLLWAKDGALAPARRRALQGAWSYHAHFLGGMDESVRLGESKGRRWLRVASILASHPCILRTPDFQQRLRDILCSRKES